MNHAATMIGTVWPPSRTLTKMLGKNGQQSNERLVLLRCKEAGVEVGFPQPLEIDLSAKGQQGLRDFIELGAIRAVQQDLAGLEEGDELVADAHRHRRFAKAGKTLKRFRRELRFCFELLLKSVARGAGLVGLRHQGAKRVLDLAVKINDVHYFRRVQV